MRATRSTSGLKRKMDSYAADRGRPERSQDGLGQSPTAHRDRQRPQWSRPFVIALAMVHGGTVVTEETLSRNLTKPRIPDVCDAMGIPRLNLLGFVQAQSWVFR
jgi:hypothetical protein